MDPDSATEQAPLLNHVSERTSKPRKVVQGALLTIFALALILFLFYHEGVQYGMNLSEKGKWPWYAGGLPKESMEAALGILEKAPVIDTHIDLAWLIRNTYSNNASAVDLRTATPGHVDIPRLRAGKVGGFFWSIYMPCPDELVGPDFLNPTFSVRDTLEQIDISLELLRKHADTFELTLTAEEIMDAIRQGKIASVFGVEGGHQLGNSIQVLRQYYNLGVRYMTLTHICHNAFADSGGYLKPFEPLHGGLSKLGHPLIYEMNRLGMLVDLSHTSDDTALQALEVSRAPVIWSHSSARSVHGVARNVPDNVLEKIGLRDGQKDAVVMVNFAPQFVAEEGKATLSAVADHVEHIAMVAGKKHVGIGSDFDGIASTPKGLEDVSKYPDLIAELYKRGWTQSELADFTGANFLRVMQGAENTAREMAEEGAEPSYAVYSKRTDL